MRSQAVSTRYNRLYDTLYRVNGVSHADPAAWDALPEDLRVVSDPAMFTKQFKTHFSLQCLLELLMCYDILSTVFGSRPSDHYFRSVCWFVCLFVCAEFFSAVFDPISIKLGCMLYVWV